MTDYEHISIEDDTDEVFATDSAPSLLAFCFIILACLGILGLGAAAVWLR